MYEANTCVKESRLKIDDLFHKKNLDTQAMKTTHWMLFIFYIPVGVMLCVIRIILIFSASLVLPVHARYEFFHRVAGFRFRSSDKLDLHKPGAIIVSNHSSYMDPAVLSKVLVKPDGITTVVWHGVNIFSRLICRPNIAVQVKNTNRDFLRQLRMASNTNQIVVFPEGAVTDCISGLLRFQPSIFRLQQPIYLVAIRYKRAIPFFHGKALSRHMGLQLLLDIFQPWIEVELKPLGLYERDTSVSAQRQADQAQSLIAEALGISATRWDRADRHSLLFK